MKNSAEWDSFFRTPSALLSEPTGHDWELPSARQS